MTDGPVDPLHALPINRRHFVIGALMAGVSAGAYAALPKPRYPAIDNRKFESWIPQKVGPWTLESVSGVVLPPPDAMADRLYDNLVTRVYEMPDGPSVMMLIAYNNKQDGVLQLHRPEICYPAGGFTLTQTQPVTLALSPGHEIPASAFTATSDRRTEQVLYWTRLGDSFPRTWIDQRISVIAANVRGDIPDGAMMRVSLFGQDQRESLDVLRRFLAIFFSHTPLQLQRILAGGNR